VFLARFFVPLNYRESACRKPEMITYLDAAGNVIEGKSTASAVVP
jgi:hypothetical protein